MTRPVTDKYPLVAKALEEQREFITKHGGSTQDVGSVASMSLRVAELVEAHVERPDDEKEALISAALLSFIPSSALGDTARLDTDYNATVRAMVEDMEAGPRSVPSESTAQIGLAVYTVTLENLTAQLANANPAEVPVNQIAAKMAQETVTFQLLEKHAAAPSLADAFSEKLDQLDALLSDIAQQQASYQQPEFEDLEEELRKLLNEAGQGGEKPTVAELRAEADRELGLSSDFNDAAAHQILGAFDANLLSKYPDVKKALQDLTRANGMCEEPVTPETVAVLSRAVSLIDQHTQGSDERKHAMAVSLILTRMSSDMEVMGFAPIFSADYSVDVQTLMQDISETETGRKSDATAQAVIFASNIVEVQETIGQVKDGKLPPAEMGALKGAVSGFAERISRLQMEDSVKALGDMLEETLIELIDAIDAKTNKGPAPKGPQG